MTITTLVENGHPLTVQTLQRRDHLGAAFWQGRAMFRFAQGTARGDVVTTARYLTPEAAEKAVVDLARKAGWGVY